MKKNKLLWGSGICVMLLASMVGLYSLKSQAEFSKVKDIYVESKVDGYHSLSEIENSVSIIVKGKKISAAPSMIERDGRGNMNLTGTLGNVEITQIYKDQSNLKLKVGEQIPVFENESYDKTQNVAYHVAGYRKMTEEKEYMLFLNYSESDGWYVPCSAIWGKYPMDKSEPVLYSEQGKTISSSDSENPVSKISVEVLEKYQ